MGKTRRRATSAPIVEGRERQTIARWLVAFAAVISFHQTSQAQDGTPAAWRVECGSDGKVLDCRVLQQVVHREDKHTIALLSVRMPADSKTPAMLIQLPLGIGLIEPVQLQVDAGPIEKRPVQACTAGGCFVGMPLNDKFLAAMRSGTMLKLTFQDSSKRPIIVDIPLLGFGLALDKIK
jgi:invasion protein IalB